MLGGTPYERAAGFRTGGYTSISKAPARFLWLPPQTPNGLAVARMARQHRPGLPIIFVTGSSELAD